MCARGNGPGQGLAVDIALVEQGAARVQQGTAEVEEASPGPDRCIAGLGIDGVNPGQQREIEQRPPGRAEWCKGVTCTGHPDHIVMGGGIQESEA